MQSARPSAPTPGGEGWGEGEGLSGGVHIGAKLKLGLVGWWREHHRNNLVHDAALARHRPDRVWQLVSEPACSLRRQQSRLGV